MLIVIFSLSGDFARRSFSELLIGSIHHLCGWYMAGKLEAARVGELAIRDDFVREGSSILNRRGAATVAVSRSGVPPASPLLLRREPMLAREAGAQLYAGGVLLA